MANGYSGLSSVKGKFWLSCIIIVSLSERGTSLSSSIPTVVDHYVSVDTNSSVFTVDGKFLSVAIDSNVLRDHWSALNFSSERMLNLAKGLSPSYVRFGGTAEDFLYYDRSNTRPNADGAQKTVRVVEYLNFFKEEHNFTITSKDLDKIHLLAQDAGWHVLFGLNVLFRGRDGAWNPSNAKMIIDYVTANGYQFGWELGNEPNLFKKFNMSISASQLGKDFGLLKGILKGYEKFGKQLLVGPDITRPYESNVQYLKTFLSEAEDLLDAVTWHQYYMDGRTCTEKDFYNPVILDYLLDQIRNYSKVVTPNTRLWLGETSSAYGSGAPGLSDRYIAGFMWMDKLGLAALLGHDIVIRQTFVRGHYALLGPTLEPMPDYWLSLVHKKLVGQLVLYVEKSLERNRTIRVYAHCTDTKSGRYNRGAVTVMAMNLQSKPVALTLIGSLLGFDVDQYLLTPYGSDVTSNRVLLNGKVLELVNDTSLPDLTGIRLPQGKPLVLPPLTFAFYVVPRARARACL